MTHIAGVASAEDRLARAIGSAVANWTKLVDALAAEFSPLEREWKPSKLEFGATCVLRHKKRALVYLIPGKGAFEASAVLGERAAKLALASELPERIKKLISEARVYVEGRGIRFTVESADDVDAVVRLVELKVTPR